MTRIVTAFYHTRAEAEKVRTALKAAHLGDDVDILDHRAADAHPAHLSLLEWLGEFFGGHSDKHIFGEGLRRGHYLLTAKVTDASETRAAEIMEAANPLDLDDEQQSWRIDGWTQPSFVPVGAPDDAAIGVAGDSQRAALTMERIDPPARLIGVCVRIYRQEDAAKSD